ncbi:MAG: response regulator [Myxococcales bacterium]|nr:response regulator [Myxococcales bacterium]
MPTILIVDDEDLIRRMLGRILRRKGFDTTLAESASEARQLLAEQEFDLVLSDVNMPGESGLDLVRHVMDAYPSTAAVMVTGVDDPQIASTALKIGAYGYIIKPFETNEVLINVANALRRRTLEIENRRYRAYLEQTVLDRTAELQKAVANLEAAGTELRVSREETIQRLARAAEFRSDETALHIRRMCLYCELLARHAGHPEEWCELIRIASPMHDIGKIGTPDSILMKKVRLTPEEFEIMKQHAEIGYRILNGSSSDMLELAAEIARSHHEKWDGSGYPAGLVGEEIPISGRICAIADVFDALTSKRCYKPEFSVEKARAIMDEGRGKHFDPNLLDLFWTHIDEVLEIKAAYVDP